MDLNGKLLTKMETNLKY